MHLPHRMVGVSACECTAGRMRMVETPSLLEVLHLVVVRKVGGKEEQKMNLLS